MYTFCVHRDYMGAMSSSPDSGANNNHVKLSESQLVYSEFGATLDVCYKLAVKYYKEAEKTGEMTFSYDDRVKLMALSKQVKNGPYADSSESAGWFDLVGSDMTRAWRDLGTTNKEDAMASFVFMMDRVCPPFKNFIADSIEPAAGDSSELKQISNGHPAPIEPSAAQPIQQQPNWEVFEAQRKQIQNALNSQTFHQFSAYAQQEYPTEPDKQAALIRQLQDQHYQQYMAQVYAQQAEQALPESERKKLSDEELKKRDDDSDVSDEEPGDDLPSNPAIAPASLWNRSDIVDFKNAIRKDDSQGVLKVGHGETVTIRVPTHEDGSSLFWEFATDHYDIGFGVYFEWSISENNQVSIHVSESDDDEDYDEALPEEGEEGAKPGPTDVEAGSAIAAHRKRDPNKPRQDEIIPVYRRDCHEEIYAGSHIYPGRGVYLLKFDNSFSLWRSKTLYYRVFYSK